MVTSGTHAPRLHVRIVCPLPNSMTYLTDMLDGGSTPPTSTNKLRRGCFGFDSVCTKNSENRLESRALSVIENKWRCTYH